MNAQEDTLMTFPCTFPLKVMGLASPHFMPSMQAIVAKHIPLFDKSCCQTKPSKTGKYASLTITFIAESKRQLDDLYREISAHPDVKMVL